MATGAVRVIWETFDSTGTPATVSWDTDLYAPPVFEDLVAGSRTDLTIGPSVVDQSFVLATAACAFLLVSDAAVLVKLKSGDTSLRTRFLLVAAEDETGAAVPAQTMLLSGNGTSTANVKIFALTKVG